MRVARVSRVAATIVALVVLALAAAFYFSYHLRLRSIEAFGRGFEVQWRVMQIRDTLTMIHGDAQLANLTGVKQEGTDKNIAVLNANITATSNLPYANDYLGDRAFAQLLAMRQTDVPALRAEFGKGQYVAAATRAETMRMAVFESASFVSQHNAALRDSAEVDAQYERVSIAAVLLFIALVTGAAVLYSMSRKSDAESIFHKSFGALHGHAIQSRLTALRLFLDYMGLQGEKTVGRFEALRVDALDAVKELDGFYAKTRTIAYADSSRELEPFTEILRVMRSANVHIAHHSNVDEVKVRAAQVTLILDELIDNAITATTGTTMPQINVWAERQINIWRMGYTLLFSVEDNGHGMSPEVRRQAQTPLFTTKAGSHNGLGLSAVTQLIQSMGGTISIRSGVGLGTSVFVRLPV